MTEKPLPGEIETLRSAATARVEAISLRGASREIGMSPSGLQKFVNGAQPYAPTLHRLRAWYGDDAAQREQDEVMARVLGLLPAQRRAAGEAVLRALLAGPVRDPQALNTALGGLEAPEDRRRIARELSMLADRARVRRTPSGAIGLGIEGAVVLSALVELLESELPQDAVFLIHSRPVRRRVLLDALREYVKGIEG